MIKRIPRNAFLVRVIPIIRLNSTLSKSDERIYQQNVSTVKGNLSKFYPKLDARTTNVVRIPQFLEKYETIDSKTQDSLTIQGRITRLRKSGKKILFVDLLQDHTRLQVVYSLTTLAEHLPSIDVDSFASSTSFLKIGDSISVTGYPFRTKAGELSLRATSPLKYLSVSLVPIPKKIGINEENKYPNYRIRNIMLDKRRMTPFIVKSIVTNSLRSFLLKKGFTEVETPMISNTANGASAVPFITHSAHLKDSEKKPLDLSLRIAPELYLKKMIVSGFDQVFEIGKVFRNEGVDAVHNPEFTTCEFYQSYTTLEGLIEMTSQILVEMCASLEQIKGKVDSQEEQRILGISESIKRSLHNGFQQFDYISTIEKQSGVELPLDLSNQALLLDYYTKAKVPRPDIISVPNLLNKLADHFIEPLCDLPSLITNHPVQLSPLAKSYSKKYGEREYKVSSRFELFIGGKEYANAYEEENSPFEQTAKFQMQLQFKNDSVDDEISMVPDETFVKALEYGMPPTGGWGCGIDRLVMLFSGCEKIDSVLSFGTLKDVIRY